MFDKYLNKKKSREKRKPFLFGRKVTKAKSVDHTCRNSGGCSYCRKNRAFNSKKKKEVADEEMKKYNERPE